jgi:hypothetical protein
MPVLGVAFLTRLLWAVVVPVIPESDATVYDHLAQNLAAGYGYVWEPGNPTAYWPVGTPFLFSLLYRLCGHHYESIVALNLFLGVGIVAETVILARRWLEKPVALLAGLMVALWPSMIEFTSIPASELPFIFLTMGAWIAILDDSWPLFPTAFVGGLLLAGASFIRPTALILLAVFMFPEFIARRHCVLRPCLKVVVAGLVMVICISPWAERNKRLMGKWVLISTNGGTNLWMGNNPETTGLYQSLPSKYDSLSEVERDKVLGEEAMAYIRQYPGRFIVRSAVKLVRLHERQSLGVVWNTEGLKSRLEDGSIPLLKLASNLYWWMALLLAAGGVLHLAKTRGLQATVQHPVVFFWISFALLHAVIVVTDRYNIPLVPAIAILGAIVLFPWAISPDLLQERTPDSPASPENGMSRRLGYYGPYRG